MAVMKALRMKQQPASCCSVPEGELFHAHVIC
jgi:hypothetical protein